MIVTLQSGQIIALALQLGGQAACVGTGLVFAQAAIGKLRNRDILPGVIANYRVLPAALVRPVTVLLAPVELVTAAALWLGSPVGVAVAIVLLLAFAGAMDVNIRRGRRHIDCGCGLSRLRQPLSRALVARNLVLAALLLPALAGGRPAATVADGLAVALAGVALYVLVLLGNALASLASSPLSAPRRS